MCGEKDEATPQTQATGVKMSPEVLKMIEAFTRGPTAYTPAVKANLGMGAQPGPGTSGMTRGKMPFGYKPIQPAAAPAQPLQVRDPIESMITFTTPKTAPKPAQPAAGESPQDMSGMSIFDFFNGGPA